MDERVITAEMRALIVGSIIVLSGMMIVIGLYGSTPMVTAVGALSLVAAAGIRLGYWCGKTAGMTETIERFRRAHRANGVGMLLDAVDKGE